MSNEIEQRFLLREIENLKQRLERLEVQEQGRFIDIPTTTTDTGIIVADGTDGKKIKSTPAKVDASGNMELPSAASLKLKSYNVGEWASYTPSVTFLGGSTNPTSLSLTARYAVVGNIKFVQIEGTLTRGSGNRSYTKITLPITPSAGGYSAACVTSFTGEFKPAAAYAESNDITVYHGTMTSDGYLWLSLMYY